MRFVYIITGGLVELVLDSNGEVVEAYGPGVPDLLGEPATYRVAFMASHVSVEAVFKAAKTAFFPTTVEKEAVF